MGIRSILSLCSAKNYTFSANSKLSFSTGYTTSIGDMMTLLTEPMQVDYRSVRTSSGIIGEQDTWHTSGEWKWQLPMQYFTLSLAASHSEGKQNTLTSQSVSGIDVSSTTLLRDSRSRSTNFSVGSTKNFPSIFTKIGADASYGFGDSEQAVNADVIKTRSNNYNLHGNASVTPIQWLELRYDIRFGWSRSRYSEESNTTTSLSHSGAIHIFPIAALDLSLDYDHVRRQLTADQYKRMSLFNASAQYKWKRLVLRLELDNLLNQRHYAYTIFNGINTYTYDYGLCGRTAHVIEKRQKTKAGRQSAMMVIHDIDQNAENMRKLAKLEEEYFNKAQYVINNLDRIDTISKDTLNAVFLFLLDYDVTQTDDSKEKIFHSSQDSWRNIDNANFIDLVEEFY